MWNSHRNHSLSLSLNSKYNKHTLTPPTTIYACKSKQMSSPHRPPAPPPSHRYTFVNRYVNLYRLSTLLPCTRSLFSTKHKPSSTVRVRPTLSTSSNPKISFFWFANHPLLAPSAYNYPTTSLAHIVSTHTARGSCKFVVMRKFSKAFCFSLIQIN